MSLDNLHYFLAVTEHGSLTAAAQFLDMPKSKLSRRLAQLEQQLGVQLLVRSTRRLQLTESGRELFQTTKPHIDALNAAKLSIKQLQEQPEGQLRVLLPLEFFSQLFTDLIAKFALNYPKIDFICHHYHQSFPDEDLSYDLIFVLHEQPLKNSTWIGKTLLSFPQSIYAGLKVNRHAITTLNDLMNVDCVQSSVGRPWFFRGAQAIEAIYVKERIVLASPEMRLSAVKKNLGVGIFPDYLVRESRQDLQKLILPSAPVAQQLSVLYQSRSIAFKTRIFLDFLQSHIGTLT